MAEANNILSDELEEHLKKMAKHTGKDSLFTHLFSETRYIWGLYQALHPEDTETTQADIRNVTLQNVFLNQSYNDVGFMAGNRLIILVEHQSQWSYNIVVRSFLYLAQTYLRHIRDTEQDVHKSKKVVLPKPELYIIFTGKREEKPDYLLLSEEFFDGEGDALEVKVKIIYDGQEGDIINQYVTFTSIFNEQVKKYGETRKAVVETIRICIDKNVLAEYLQRRKGEVENIMMTMYDNVEILRSFIISERREAADEAAEKADKEATKRTIRKTALKLYHRGTPVADISDILDTPAETIRKWIEA